MDAYERECYRLQLLEDMDYYFDRQTEEFLKWRAEQDFVTTDKDARELAAMIRLIKDFWENNENHKMYNIALEEWDRHEFDSERAEHE